MLPRSIFAGIYYFNQPGFTVKPTNKYIYAAFSSSSIAIITILLVRAVEGTSNLLEHIALLTSIILLIITTIPLASRSTIKKLFEWTPYFNHIKKIKTDPTLVHQINQHLVFITIFNPPCVKELDENLKRIKDCFLKANANFLIFAVIDGAGIYKNSDDAINVAQKHCAFVGAGNMQRKRANLKWMIDLAWDRQIINNSNKTNTLIHFIDDDTFPGNDDLVIRLTEHFDDPNIGGVTTSQYVREPKYFWQHVMQLFEMARNYGSQACLSLFGSVGCLPGRWYCVRANHITQEFGKRLSEETISFFGYLSRIRDPGDDRYITIEVQKSGKLTIMEPSARVYTLSPKSFKKFWGMVTRWARSSNIYTIQNTSWMIRKIQAYPTLLLYWSNIFLAFATVYITGPYLLWSLITGTRQEPLYLSIALALLSMFLTMSIRQIAVIWTTPKYISFISILGLLGILMQVAQIWGMMTYLESKWTGVRPTSSETKKVTNQINLIHAT
ncbi:Chitin synthase [Synechococcus sp. MIT S9509]|uniref:glycosyltransferase family 2 protein n=2 Tax=unclassified Synechococcus TaxID=2626047 RepID=UPI0007BC5887|nr:glycosyltransferase family 2 protein [Synechococcus sp. MIT S9504]KZR83062.1 Chitin synthase [Synechococcus sp. MIT S9504]KZR88269.1 Chitin synthase [Synechococcus sp. MIT S9509]